MRIEEGLHVGDVAAARHVAVLATRGDVFDIKFAGGAAIFCSSC